MNGKNFFPNAITQDMILPGVVKQRHLVPSPTRKGDMYYGNDGISFSNLPIGNSYQFLMVVKGVPAWVTFPQTGVAASRPSSGRFTGDQYYATDSFAFSVWNGSVWKSTTLA